MEAPFQLVDGSDADRRAQRIRRNRGTANYGDGNRSAGATRREGEEGEEEGEAFHCERGLVAFCVFGVFRGLLWCGGSLVALNPHRRGFVEKRSRF